MIAWILVVLVLALNVADAMLTDAVLRRGGVESNPVMRWIMLHPITRPYRWAIKLVVAVGLCWLVFPNPWLLAIVAAPFVWVVWHNAAVLRGQMARRPSR